MSLPFLAPFDSSPFPAPRPGIGVSDIAADELVFPSCVSRS